MLAQGASDGARGDEQIHEPTDEGDAKLTACWSGRNARSTMQNAPKLAAEVLRLALSDALESHDAGYQSGDLGFEREAREWLMDDGSGPGSARWWCDIAGVDYAAMRERLTPRLGPLQKRDGEDARHWTMEKVERAAVVAALARTGNIHRAATQLRVSDGWVRSRIEKWHLENAVAAPSASA